jgi:hypothetical protein
MLIMRNLYRFYLIFIGDMYSSEFWGPLTDNELLDFVQQIEAQYQLQNTDTNVNEVAVINTEAVEQMENMNTNDMMDSEVLVCLEDWETKNKEKKNVSNTHTDNMTIEDSIIEQLPNISEVAKLDFTDILTFFENLLNANESNIIEEVLSTLERWTFFGKYHYRFLCESC